jgi:Txe/YoeB family toxin of Txe-Axe toxin-antitoxin module
MRIEPLRNDLKQYIKKRSLIRKWNKSVQLFEDNIRHPSLHVELLEPHWRGIHSFRIDKKYRALFFVRRGVVEVFQITNHYTK